MPAPIDIVKGELPALLPRLWRFGVMLCRSPEHVPDLVQMTCLRAMEKAGQFEPGTRFDRWCFAIMASIWKNELRSRSVRRGNGQVDAELALVFDAREHTEREIFTKQVFEEVQRLPDAQRVAVLLIYVEGYRYSEAAQLLEIPIGTLMSRLAAAKTALGRRLAPDALPARRTVEPGA